MEHQRLYGIAQHTMRTLSFCHVGNVCYFSHQMWLPWDHEWRNKPETFDGTTMYRPKPRELPEDEILSKLNMLQFGEGSRPVEQLN